MRAIRFFVLAAFPAAAWSQAVVEYGLGVAASGTAGAGARAASRGIAGALSNLTKSLNESGDRAQAPQSNTSVTIAPAKLDTPPAKSATVYEDPAGIKAGMEQAELLKRFGEPVMKVTAGANGESLTYTAKDRIVEVEMRGGKVWTVQTKSQPRQSAVVLLQ
jgi:YD repeat-containing protein